MCKKCYAVRKKKMKRGKRMSAGDFDDSDEESFEACSAVKPKPRPRAPAPAAVEEGAGGASNTPSVGAGPSDQAERQSEAPVVAVVEQSQPGGHGGPAEENAAEENDPSEREEAGDEPDQRPQGEHLFAHCLRSWALLSHLCACGCSR